MRSINIVIGFVLGSLFVGCAAVGTTVLPDETLVVQTAKVISEPAKNIVISNRSEESVYTHYTVTTKGGKSYSCKIIGGSLSTIALLGQSERPECRKMGTKK